MSKKAGEKGNRLPSYEERILQRIPREILVISFLISLLSLIFFDALTSLFVFAGGGLASFGFLWLKTSLGKFLVPEKKRALKSGLVLYSIRLLLILAIFSIIIIIFSEKVIAFAVGFSTIILVLMMEALIGLAELRKWKS